jgi:hypothetical protein
MDEDIILLVRASRALLIGLEEVSSEMVAHCLLITQCTPVLKRSDCAEVSAEVEYA